VKAWCLLMHAEASLFLSLSRSEPALTINVEPPDNPGKTFSLSNHVAAWHGSTKDRSRNSTHFSHMIISAVEYHNMIAKGRSYAN